MQTLKHFLSVFYKVEPLELSLHMAPEPTQHYISIHIAIVCINCINPHLTQPKLSFLIKKKVTKIS